jgi:hypothetical protein
MAKIDAVHEGLQDPDPKAEHIGALAALLTIATAPTIRA